MSDLLSEYLHPVFNIDHIDRYYVRKSILQALKENKHLLTGRMLDVGCGKMPYRELLSLPEGKVEKYIGLDLEQAVTNAYGSAKPDLLWDGATIPVENENVDSILLTEVLEHCFEPLVTLKECNRVLKKGGHIFITVPFLWPLHDIPYDEYRYTPYSLEKHLSNAGFTNIQVKALGGWNASLGQMFSLWLNRSGLSAFKRKTLYFFIKPFVSWLYRTDICPDNFIDNTYMITGLYATAQKK